MSGLICGFSVDVTDGSTETIRCVFFDKAAEKYNQLLQVNDTYTFCGGILRGYDESKRMKFYFDEHCIIERELNTIEEEF